MSNTENLTVEEVVVVPHIEPTMNLSDVYPGEHKVEFVGVPQIDREVESSIVVIPSFRPEAIFIVYKI
jgi:hypothetical protein